MVNITGVWNLVSFNVYLNGTSVRQPNGPNPLGKAIIMPDYISFHITTPEAAVPLPNGAQWRDGADHDIAEIARPHVSYCGRWTAAYLGEQLQLTTTVDVSLDPSWTPRPQRRNVSFVEENGKPYMLLIPVDSVAVSFWFYTLPSDQARRVQCSADDAVLYETGKQFWRNSRPKVGKGR